MPASRWRALWLRHRASHAALWAVRAAHPVRRMRGVRAASQAPRRTPCSRPRIVGRMRMTRGAARWIGPSRCCAAARVLRSASNDCRRARTADSRALHTHTQTRVRCTHIHARMYTHAGMYTHSHSHTRTCMHAHTCTHAHPSTRPTPTRPRTRAHTHARSHTQAIIRPHARTAAAAAHSSASRAFRPHRTQCSHALQACVAGTLPRSRNLEELMRTSGGAVGNACD